MVELPVSPRQWVTKALPKDRMCYFQGDLARNSHIAESIASPPSGSRWRPPASSSSSSKGSASIISLRRRSLRQAHRRSPAGARGLSGRRSRRERESELRAEERLVRHRAPGLTLIRSAEHLTRPELLLVRRVNLNAIGVASQLSTSQPRSASRFPPSASNRSPSLVSRTPYTMMRPVRPFSWRCRSTSEWVIRIASHSSLVVPFTSTLRISAPFLTSRSKLDLAEQSTTLKPSALSQAMESSIALPLHSSPFRRSFSPKP